ncbi:Uncharacterised protein [Klebsiella michiganensis]|uniref:Uncharacterized protein n=1 Tax=Klebsiella michiganensis TaxID=1134687 RepID=A0A7H4N096_9ENTR|nr:Uncharacterised protein [Klebsiella michiganensis]
MTSAKKRRASAQILGFKNRNGVAVIWVTVTQRAHAANFCLGHNFSRQLYRFCISNKHMMAGLIDSLHMIFTFRKDNPAHVSRISSHVVYFIKG